MYSAAIRAGHDYQRDLAETKAAADSLVPFIDGLDARFKKSFQAEDGSYPCSDRWKSIVNDWRSIQPEHNGTKIYTELCIEVREWILRDIGNHSNLNLDSELDSTWMIDALVSKLPAIARNTMI